MQVSNVEIFILKDVSSWKKIVSLLFIANNILEKIKKDLIIHFSFLFLFDGFIILKTYKLRFQTHFLLEVCRDLHNDSAAERIINDELLKTAFYSYWNDQDTVV